MRLADTAGLWEPSQRVDQLGVEVSRRYLAAADLVLLCAEGGRALGPDERAIMAERPTLLIRTKGDLHPEPPTEGVTVSVITGQGLDALRSAAAELVFGERIALGDLEPTLTRWRCVAPRRPWGRAWLSSSRMARSSDPSARPPSEQSRTRSAAAR